MGFGTMTTMTDARQDNNFSPAVLSAKCLAGPSSVGALADEQRHHKTGAASVGPILVALLRLDHTVSAVGLQVLVLEQLRQTKPTR